MNYYYESFQIADYKQYVLDGLNRNHNYNINVFEFLLERHFDEIIDFLESQQLHLQQLLMITNNNFHRQFINYKLFNDEQPVPSNWNQAVMLGLCTKEFQYDIKEIFQNGDALTIAQLLIKQVCNNIKTQLQMTNFVQYDSQQIETLSKAKIIQLTPYFNVLNNEIQIPMNYQQIISANPIDIHNILQNVISSSDSIKLLSNFNFKIKLPKYLSQLVLNSDHRLDKKVDQLINKLIQNQNVNILSDAQYIFENLQMNTIEGCIDQMIIFCSMLASKYNKIYLFDIKQLKVISINFSFELAEYIHVNIKQLYQKIIDIFQQSKILFSRLMSIASPYLILPIIVKNYPYISISSLIQLRTYQDGPIFINQLLELLIDPAFHRQAPLELIYFVFEFAQKLPWLYETSLFKGQDVQLTKNLLIRLASISKEIYEVDMILVTDQLPRMYYNLLPIQTVENLENFIRFYNFDLESISDCLIAEIFPEIIVDEKLKIINFQQNNLMIIISSILYLSQKISDFTIKLSQRVRILHFLFLLIKKYRLILENTDQFMSRVYNQETSFVNIFIYNLVLVISHFFQTDQKNIQSLQTQKVHLEQKANSFNKQFQKFPSFTQQKAKQIFDQIGSLKQLKQKTETEYNQINIQYNKIQQQVVKIVDDKREEFFNINVQPIMLKRNNLGTKIDELDNLLKQANSIQQQLNTEEKQAYSTMLQFSETKVNYDLIYVELGENEKSAAFITRLFKEDMFQIQSFKNKPWLFSILQDVCNTEYGNSIFEQKQFENVCFCEIPTEKNKTEISFKLNQIVPQTAFQLGQSIQYQFNANNRYVVSNLVFERLLQGQTFNVLIEFIQSIYKIESIENTADYVLKQFVLPFFYYIFPRFFIFDFIHSNQLNKEKYESITTQLNKYHQYHKRLILLQGNKAVKQLQQIDMPEIKSNQIPNSNKSFLNIQIEKLAQIMSQLINIRGTFLQKQEFDIIWWMVFSFNQNGGLIFTKMSTLIRILITEFINNQPEYKHQSLQVIIYNYVLLVNIINSSEIPSDSLYYLISQSPIIKRDYQIIQQCLLKFDINTLDDQMPDLVLLRTLFLNIPEQIQGQMCQLQAKGHRIRIIQSLKPVKSHFSKCEILKLAIQNICTQFTPNILTYDSFGILNYLANELQKLWVQIAHQLDKKQQQALSLAAFTTIDDILKKYRRNGIQRIDLQQQRLIDILK